MTTTTTDVFRNWAAIEGPEVVEQQIATLTESQLRLRALRILGALIASETCPAVQLDDAPRDSWPLVRQMHEKRAARSPAEVASVAAMLRHDAAIVLRELPNVWAERLNPTAEDYTLAAAAGDDEPCIRALYLEDVEPLEDVELLQAFIVTGEE